MGRVCISVSYSTCLMLTIFQNLCNAKEPGSVECYLLDIPYSPPLYRHDVLLIITIYFVSV